MPKPGEYERSFQLKSNDVDLANRWKPSAILIAAQELGAEHSQILRCGHDELASKDVFFVLMRQMLHMQRYPSFGESVHGTTWAFVNRTVFQRCFLFCGDDGRTLGTLSTIWMLCALSDRKLVDPANYGIEIPLSERPPLKKPSKLRFEGPPDIVIPRVSQYSDMDYNGHVNNARYADWVCDLFEPQRFAERSVDELHFNYVSELRGREVLTLSLHEAGDCFTVVGKSQKDDHTVFLSTGRWSEK